MAARVISYSAFKAARGRVDPLIADIIDALRAANGVAHRQDVAHWIASRRAGKPVRASALDCDEIYRAFNDYIAMAERRRPPPLLHMPLGPDSYRWALTREACDLLDTKPVRDAAGAVH